MLKKIKGKIRVKYAITGYRVFKRVITMIAA